MNDMWNDRRLFLLLLAAVYIIARLPFLDVVPFMKDEGLYSVMVEEQIEHPTLVVTLFDYPVAWKPPVYFWVSGLFIPFLKSLDFLSIEAVYRIPGLLFGLINVYLVFLILEKLTKETDQAFLGALIYSTFFIAIHTELRVLTDSLCGTTLLAAILFYIYGLRHRRFFLLGGLFTFITYFVKQTNAAAIPVVAAALIFEKDRKKLLDPVFLVSLLSFPLASWALGAISWGAPTGAVEHYFIENIIFEKLNPKDLYGSLLPLFINMSIWLSVSLFGLWKNWKRSLMLSVWFGLIIFPFIGGSWMPWYFYPVLLPIAYFSLQLLIRDKDGSKVKDIFFYSVFLILIVFAYGMGLYNHLSYKEVFIHEKNAGELLAGKDNVLIIGLYEPSVPTYKMLEEKRLSGKWKDFGWIIIMNRSGEAYEPFLKDYYSNHTKAVDGNFAALFAIDSVFRKDTNITSFDFICIVGNDTINPGGELLFNQSNTTIFRVR